MIFSNNEVDHIIRLMGATKDLITKIKELKMKLYGHVSQSAG
jgi:hypothetical protein